MRELTWQDVDDILVGATVLGCGGGGDLEEGREQMRTAYGAGRAVTLAAPDELPADALVMCPYGVGGLTTGDAAEYAGHAWAEEHPSVLAVCALTGRGMKKLAALIKPGDTVAFIGTSGVGKSSLINQLYGEDLMPTIEVRTQDSKGRHTTSWREMIFLPKGGVVIDTPGMREFHLWGASEGTKETFPEIEALAAGCHFRDCTHTQEKDCAVLAALAVGTLPRERHDSFVKLQREISYLHEAKKQAGWQTRRKSDRVAHRVFNKQA